jgi:hypothetical protein
MYVNPSIKRYWARTGPNSVFGNDWSHRQDFTNEEAEERFDDVWSSTLYPAIQSGRKISSVKAKTMIPNDKRMAYFDPCQEHREFRLGDATLIAQIKPGNNSLTQNSLTQMWHMNDKGSNASGVSPSRTATPVVPAAASIPTAACPVPTVGNELLTRLAHQTGVSEEAMLNAVSGAISRVIAEAISGPIERELRRLIGGLN